MSGPGIEESERMTFNGALMKRLEEFYFDESGTSNGQMLFFAFAQNNHTHFTEECDATKVEQSLHTTNVYQEFCSMFEKEVEKIIDGVNPQASGEDFIAALKW